MLKGIDPVLTPDLLKVLMEMGHDDTVVLVDANFTAASLAGAKPLIRLPGIGLLRAVQAVVSVFPLVADEKHPVGYMEVGGQAGGYRSALQREVLAALELQMLPGQSAQAIERYAFYARTREAYAIVVTGELQPYGNVLLRKGVTAENLRP